MPKLPGSDLIYGEDCIGLFLEPEPGGNVAYQVYINPLGTIFDQRLTANEDGYWDGDPDWNGAIEVATGRGEGYWTVEIRIPVERFGVQIGPGIEWGLNLRRKQPEKNASANWQSPIEYDPQTYGILEMK